MIPLFDQQTKDLIGGLRPRWSCLRVAKRRFSGLEPLGFRCASMLFVGQPTLLCGINPKDFPVGPWEYFPIRCDIVDESVYDAEDLALARAGGASEFDRKMQWLFETPLLTLTEGNEEFWDGISPDAKHYEFTYYNGLEISDPKGRGKLRLTASDMPDFVLTADLSFGPGDT